MPYLCNLDYVMFGVFGVPLFREHTCFEDGDYCDFKLKMDTKPMEYWPPVFEQGIKTARNTIRSITGSRSITYHSPTGITRC